MINSDTFLSHRPVEFIVHVTIKEALRESVEKAQAGFVNEAASFSGHIQSATKEIPCERVGWITFIAVHCFDSSNHLVRWLESDNRRVLMERFNDSFKGCFEVNYPSNPDGFSLWISDRDRRMGPENAVARWKMNAIVLVILYPLTLILPDFLRQIMPHASKPTTQLMTATVAVSLLGFWLVPLVSGWMTAWLNAKSFLTQAIGGVCLAGVLYGIWQWAYLMHI